MVTPSRMSAGQEVAAVSFVAALLAVEITGPHWAFEVIYWAGLLAGLAYTFRRRGTSRAVGRAARLRQNAFYAARREGASGPDAWVRSGQPEVERRANLPASV